MLSYFKTLAFRIKSVIKEVCYVSRFFQQK